MRENEEATDLAQYKASGKPFKVFWMAAGKLDMADASSKVTAEMLKKAGIQAEQHESEGFHAWNNWRDYLHTFAPLLFR
jgi:enterochelin esterase family protein